MPETAPPQAVAAPPRTSPVSTRPGRLSMPRALPAVPAPQRTEAGSAPPHGPAGCPHRTRPRPAAPRQSQRIRGGRRTLVAASRPGSVGSARPPNGAFQGETSRDGAAVHTTTMTAEAKPVRPLHHPARALFSAPPQRVPRQPLGCPRPTTRQPAATPREDCKHPSCGAPHASGGASPTPQPHPRLPQPAGQPTQQPQRTHPRPVDWRPSPRRPEQGERPKRCGNATESQVRWRPTASAGSPRAEAQSAAARRQSARTSASCASLPRMRDAHNRSHASDNAQAEASAIAPAEAKSAPRSEPTRPPTKLSPALQPSASLSPAPDAQSSRVSQCARSPPVGLSVPAGSTEVVLWPPASRSPSIWRTARSAAARSAGWLERSSTVAWINVACRSRSSCDPCTGDPCTGDPCTGDPCTGDPCTGDPCTGGTGTALPACTSAADAYSTALSSSITSGQARHAPSSCAVTGTASRAVLPWAAIAAQLQPPKREHSSTRAPRQQADVWTARTAPRVSHHGRQPGGTPPGKSERDGAYRRQSEASHMPRPAGARASPALDCGAETSQRCTDPHAVEAKAVMARLQHGPEQPLPALPTPALPPGSRCCNPNLAASPSSSGCGRRPPRS
eukprot:scaffold10181_cov120-Isochrysis_galbana.AAC.4